MEGGENLGVYIDDRVCSFSWFLCTFGPTSRALVAYHLQRVGMPLHDAAVGVNCQKEATTENQGTGS